MRIRTGILVFSAALAQVVLPAECQSPPAARAESPEAPAAEVAVPERETDRKRQLVAEILVARERATGRSLGSSSRGALADKLLRVPEGALEAFLDAGGLGDVEALAGTASGRAGLAVGDTGADLVYTPLSPCRIIDTRLAGGVLLGGTSRSFLVTGSTGFAAQGGTGCGIPDEATSVMMNFVAVSPAGPGDLRAYRYGASAPNASVVNYADVAGLNVANGVVQPICNVATTTCTYDLVVQADVSATDVVVDVLGYFRRLEVERLKSLSYYDGASTETVGTTCGNYGGLSVTVTAPVAGSVVLTAALTLYVDHVGGLPSYFTAKWGTAPTTCSYSAASVTLPSDLPTGTYASGSSATRRFTISSGSTVTYYLNSYDSSSGGSIQVLVSSALTAVFVPD